ncbi:MAG: hypothetical protein AXW17_08755 [Colwellia sp. Phe_37]|nr:MAG: hypothetical protein AXW17_08755 [Colwellia sp. Phe_37]
MYAKSCDENIIVSSHVAVLINAGQALTSDRYMFEQVKISLDGTKFQQITCKNAELMTITCLSLAKPCSNNAAFEKQSKVSISMSERVIMAG